MGTIQALSITGANAIAAANKTRNAMSVLHLFKSPFLPSPTTALAEFTSNECDYDGYAAITLTVWNDPILLGLGWATMGPTSTFRWEHDTADVGNSVGGWYLVTAGGVLIAYSVFDPPQSMTGPGQAIVTTPIQITQAGRAELVFREGGAPSIALRRRLSAIALFCRWTFSPVPYADLQNNVRVRGSGAGVVRNPCPTVRPEYPGRFSQSGHCRRPETRDVSGQRVRD